MRKMYFPILALAFVPACDKLQSNSGILGGLYTPSGAGSTTATVAPPTVETNTTVSDGGTTVAPSFSGAATTVAGLGDPTVSGLWMETPLVSSPQTARVRSASGNEAVLNLRPIPGEASAGSRLSIDAMRALGLPLTELVEVQVYPAS